MKIHRLDAHDRLQEFKKQGDYISKGCEDCIKKRPEEFGDHPFYIFAHKREIGMDERFSLFMTGNYKSFEETPTHRLIWQPRLSKPEAQTNSMLFKSYPLKDEIKVIWIIPDRVLWDQYTKGNMVENKTVCESIYDFDHDRGKLEAKEEDDLSDARIKEIYALIKKHGNSKPKPSVES
jgi:hypothetical protein